ncbi:hypothetical protein DFH08DRAFT_838794 [Mycena albidolilacea]|uniref:Uncharacterized protein n=1 Tax=Mycena albidolilacea TaxID=1033008 RepID=A0AAD7F384_9AGAR|nr:hypothetical protein DFH08DRAFT_838794 [Mycena albidolilacea]
MKCERNESPASGTPAQGSAPSLDPGTNQVVAQTLPIALIGGFGGRGGRATGPDGQGGEGGLGEGNILPSTVLYYLEKRGRAVAGTPVFTADSDAKNDPSHRGGVGGEGGEGKTAGRGGKAGGNTVHHEKWYFGDTTAVAIVAIKEFCDSLLLDNVCKHLISYGIMTANALFDLDDEDISKLKDLGVKPGEIAGLRNGLKKLVAHGDLEPKPVPGI